MDHVAEPQTAREAAATVWARENASLEAGRATQRLKVNFDVMQQKIDDLEKELDNARKEKLAIHAEIEKAQARHEGALINVMRAHVVFDSFKATSHVRPSFQDLPPEMRANIWKFCLPDANNPEPGILFAHDCTYNNMTAMARGKPSEGPMVLIAFPVIMHLCHESRDFAKRHLSLTRASVPQRPYRQDIDTFYVEEPTNLLDTMLQIKDHFGHTTDFSNQQYVPFFSKIQYLAVDSPYFNTEILRFMPFLRQLSVTVTGPGDTILWNRSNRSGLLRLTPYQKESVWLNPWSRLKDETPVSTLVDQIHRALRLQDSSISAWNQETGKPRFAVAIRSITRIKGIL